MFFFLDATSFSTSGTCQLLLILPPLKQFENFSIPDLLSLFLFLCFCSVDAAAVFIASGHDSHLHAGRRTQLKLKSLLKHIASPQTCTRCSAAPSLNIIAHIKSKLGKPCRHLSIFVSSVYTRGEIPERRKICTALPDDFLRIPVQLLRILVYTSLKTQPGRST